MARKTVSLRQVIERINGLIETAESDRERRRLMTMAEDFLHLTGQYRGFQYLDWENGGYDRWVADGKPEDNHPYIGNKTRVYYYLPPR